MQKLLLGISVILISIAGANSQTLVARVMSPKTAHWGYCNIKGEMIIAPEYRLCSDFTPEGLAAIFRELGKDYYFINLKGERVPTEITGYRLVNTGTHIKGFSDGMVAVRNGDWGYMDTKGHLAIPMKYDLVHDFNGGSSIARKKGKYVVLNKKGEEFPVDADDMRDFSEGMAPFIKDGRFGFVGADGKVVVAPIYRFVGAFKNGYAWVKGEDLKIGFIDKTGTMIIKPQFNMVGDFSSGDGLAKAKKDKVWGYINTKGETVLTPDTEFYGDFFDGLAMGRKDGKIGFFNTKGEWIIAPKFDLCHDFKNGYAAAKEGFRWGVIDKTGEWVIKPQFREMFDFEIVN
jgi:WG containing repeat